MSSDSDCQILISDDKIAFPVQLFRAGNSVIEQTEECLMTPYGAFFSINAYSYNVIDFLETNGKDYSAVSVAKAVILDHEGRLYEVSVIPDGTTYQLIKNRLQYGKRIRYAISSSGSLEIEGNVALDISQGVLELATKAVTSGSIREIITYDHKPFSYFIDLLKDKTDRKPIRISKEEEN